MNTNQVAKRYACDRCRDQKLRCLRSSVSLPPPSAGSVPPPAGPCDRCIRVGARCVTSSGRPLGRPPLAQHGGSGFPVLPLDVLDGPSVLAASGSTFHATRRNQHRHGHRHGDQHSRAGSWSESLPSPAPSSPSASAETSFMSRLWTPAPAPEGQHHDQNRAARGGNDAVHAHLFSFAQGSAAPQSSAPHGPMFPQTANGAFDAALDDMRLPNDDSSTLGSNFEATSARLRFPSHSTTAAPIATWAAPCGGISSMRSGGDATSGTLLHPGGGSHLLDDDETFSSDSSPTQLLDPIERPMATIGHEPSAVVAKMLEALLRQLVLFRWSSWDADSWNMDGVAPSVSSRHPLGSGGRSRRNSGTTATPRTGTWRDILDVNMTFVLTLQLLVPAPSQGGLLCHSGANTGRSSGSSDWNQHNHSRASMSSSQQPTLSTTLMLLSLYVQLAELLDVALVPAHQQLREETPSRPRAVGIVLQVLDHQLPLIETLLGLPSDCRLWSREGGYAGLMGPDPSSAALARAVVGQAQETFCSLKETVDGIRQSLVKGVL
ncbi:hypothetical protein RB595_006938 [Gaeumannomyces hyphopodioides]